ncbi:hypothetical protein Pmani_015394 [Petrolisthes manimaculis]|uniref:Ionotropic glutamate receptor C-terminal domain-containing protein n=1 Tax=Petrolisthes manimaculis TaxID=1843537 RepID=A0AAE1U7P7_9EUCA|nr:hypothetical protein Pmani_015394 [Petrolisthes manimaculis]
MSTVLVNVRYEPFTLPGNDMEAGLLVSLVLFLLQPSQHTEVVIIHDYTLPGVKELAESFSERWAATTLLTATPAPDLSQLLVALTSFHTNDLRYMVLLCSANTTRIVFDMVSRHNLESRRVRWLVVGKEPNVADTLPLSLREGSMESTTAPRHRYRVQVPDDRKWGNVLEDGTVTGMVGEVFDRRAHFAIDEISITDHHLFCFDVLESRETVVDFTYPYFFDTTSLVSRAPEERNRSLAVFYPFSSHTWITVVLVTLLMGPLGYLFSRVHHQLTQTFDSTHNERSRNVGPSFDSGRIKWGSEPGLRGVEMFCFNMFRTIIIQGNLLPASSWPLRLVFFSWYAVCVILYAVYAGTLTAYLTKPSFDKPIDSLEDLFVARDRGVVAAVTSGTNKEALFKVVEENTAWIGGRVGLEIYSVRYLDEPYHIASNNFYPQPCGIVCPSGAPYTDTLNLMLGRMVQSGLVDKWYNGEVAKLKQREEGKGGGTHGQQDHIASQPLTLDHLQV